MFVNGDVVVDPSVIEKNFLHEFRVDYNRHQAISYVLALMKWEHRTQVEAIERARQIRKFSNPPLRHRTRTKTKEEKHSLIAMRDLSEKSATSDSSTDAKADCGDDALPAEVEARAKKRCILFKYLWESSSLCNYFKEVGVAGLRAQGHIIPDAVGEMMSRAFSEPNGV